MAREDRAAGRTAGLVRKVTRCGILAAAALVLGYFETFLPMPGVPGVKLGLANISVLLALVLLGPGWAAFVAATRVFVAGILYAGLAGMLYSLGGAALSFCGMALALRFFKGFSLIGVSVIGAVLHNVGQLCVAALLMGTSAVFGYLPVLLLAAAVTGVLTGLAARGTVAAVEKGMRR